MFLCLDGHSGELREILLEEYTVSGLSVAWERHRFFCFRRTKKPKCMCILAFNYSIEFVFYLYITCLVALITLSTFGM